jgi:hypothetical protein
MPVDAAGARILGDHYARLAARRGAKGVGVGAAVATGSGLPSRVDQLPQLPTTTSGTVAACSLLAARTQKLVCRVTDASETVKLPREPVCPPRISMNALVAVPKANEPSRLAGSPGAR